MKSNLLFFCFFYLYCTFLAAENVLIKSEKISFDKNKEISVFQDNIEFKTSDNRIIKSDYAEFNKKTGIIKFKKNIFASDQQNNIINTEYAEFDQKTKIFLTKGVTKITTSEKYIIEGSDIIYNKNKNLLYSKNKTKLVDQDKNSINLTNFEYQINESIFKSIGEISITDNSNNNYEFSQIYIDTKKKEIIGTDIKARMDPDQFGVNSKNKPRLFANTIQISKDKNIFNKGIFTLCDYRKNDKCPPWQIQSTKILHDNKKKTIYYDNAIIKIYNIPIFYFPKLSHPDPTVDRRSGFLPPTFYDTKNLGAGLSVPYFFALDKDKNFTLTNRFYVSENPLFMGEYHQAFKNSNFFAEFGFTEGYKKSSNSKNEGSKSHFFSKFVKNFKGTNNSDNNLTITTQSVSNNKYLKLYDISTELVNHDNDTLENKIEFSRETENTFIGFNASVYEDLANNNEYEYILPEIIVDKSLTNNKFGSIDFQSNLKMHNYDTNKVSRSLINDLNWNSQDFYFKSSIKNKFLTKIRNINYENKNIDQFKEDFTNELYGALALYSELSLEKENGLKKYNLKPKSFLRFAPGNMRKENSGQRLNTLSAFSIDRLNSLTNFETGLSGAFGFDYQIKDDNNEFNFSVAQIINEKKSEKNIIRQV